jgi:hypothetical protein
LDEWRTNITANLVPDLSAYAVRDYRRFLSAHLQFLTGLCDLSIQSANDAVIQFLSSLFVTTQLMPQTNFDAYIYLLIDQSKSNAPVTFARFLFLLRETNHGNAIISAYDTNFEYIAPWYNITNSPVITQTVTYDDACSCALDANCTIQAIFVQADLSGIVPVKGLKMGCTPSQSFLGSTLECFYDSSCINLIQQQTNNISTVNATSIPPLLSATPSRFSMNTSVIDLVNELYIENWSATINYSAYFDQCSPMLCSYTYIQQLNSLYTVTLLLGLYGGLSFILKWICPKITYIAAKVYKGRKKQTNSIQPAHGIEMATIEVVSATLNSADAHVTTADAGSASTPSVSPYISFS